jgi:hypothetical protein
MTDKVLYPADRVAPEAAKLDKAELRESLKAAIRALVPDSGKPMTYDAIVYALRHEKSRGFYVFWPGEIYVAIDEVKAERPVESQADCKAVAVDAKLLEGVEVVEERPL